MARSRLRGFGWSEKNCSPRDPPCEESFSENRANAIGLYTDSAIRCDPVKSAWLSAVREYLAARYWPPIQFPVVPGALTWSPRQLGSQASGATEWPALSKPDLCRGAESHATFHAPSRRPAPPRCPLPSAIPY